MKRIFAALTAALCLSLSITGCSSEEELVSRKPFPEFSAEDMDGNTVTNEVFSEYDVTLVNFWNNG